MTSTAPSQISFALAEYEGKKKITRRELFLAKMEQVVPWSRLLEVIEPFYPKSVEFHPELTQGSTLDGNQHPTQLEIDWAHRVLDALAAGPLGAITVDGKLVDKPIAMQAQSILDETPMPDSALVV